MNILKHIFGKKNEQIPVEQAVIAKFKYEESELAPLSELCGSLESVISQNQVGEFDGHEIATDLSDGLLYMYGIDADALFKAIEPMLVGASCMNDVVATIR